jgi:hypothetical protein
MKSEGTNDTYQGLFGLDRLPNNIKTLIWVVCLILATELAISGYHHVYEAIASTSISRYFLWLSIISPICIAVAVLRLAGVKWRYGFLLFLFVPMVVYGRMLAVGILYGLMGD